MGLISRVSSRTYRLLSEKCQHMDSLNKPSHLKTLNKTPFIQLAGHITFSEKQIPCIIPNHEKDNQTIFKLIQPPPKGQIEFIFYRHKHIYMSRFENFERELKIDKHVNIESSYPNVQCHFSDSGLSDWSTQNRTNVSFSQSDHHSQSISYQITVESSIESSIQKTSRKVSSSTNSYRQQYCRFDDLKNISPDSLKKFLFDFTPTFYGIHSINGYDYLELENLYASFPNPCLADVKIGKQTFDPTADEAKRKRRMAKWPPLQTLGYQFLGIQRGLDGKHLDRSWCRSLKLEEIFTAFSRFLPEPNIEQKQNQIELIHKIKNGFTRSINEITHWTENQTAIQLYATSLYLCYCNSTGRTKIKLIDFAHIFFEEGRRDENFIDGIKNFTRDLNLACDRLVDGLK